MSVNRVAWLRVINGQFVIMKGYDEEAIPDIAISDDDEKVSETGPDIRLLLPRPQGRPITFNITALTHKEFLAMKKFFGVLFDMAEPTIIERDRRAQIAWDQGDDSFARSYRQVPQLVIREGPFRTDDQGVHLGPEDLSDGDRSNRDDGLRVSDGGVRGAGNELASSESESDKSEDDEQASD